MDTGIDVILAEKARRVARDKAAAERREENGERQAILIERDPSGLYWCRYEKGQVPTELRGMFTHIQHIYNFTKARDLPVKVV